MVTPANERVSGKGSLKPSANAEAQAEEPAIPTSIPNALSFVFLLIWTPPYPLCNYGRARNPKNPTIQALPIMDLGLTRQPATKVVAPAARLAMGYFAGGSQMRC